MRPQYRVPGATYRLQFNQDFVFSDAIALLDYLEGLGITDLYSSPHFKARRGSSHGYDIANPMRINPELGSQEDFDRLASELRERGMGLLLDIVPNHLAASPENPWWLDVLEHGKASEFADFFDINWHPAITKSARLQDDRILLPILGDLYGNVLESGALQLELQSGRIFVCYNDMRLPLDPKTYQIIVEHCLQLDPACEALQEIEQVIVSLPSRDETDADRVSTRRRQSALIIATLRAVAEADHGLKKLLEEALKYFNGSAQEPRSFEPLDRLLSEQVYRLAHWKLGSEEINYRRFFDINDLVRLRVELPEAFYMAHRKVFELVRDGKVTGLRVDHVDGLFDPADYLNRLQWCLSGDPTFYLVVEKILAYGESLRDWPVDGTTGYDFLNAVNRLFFHPGGLAPLARIHSRIAGEPPSWRDLSYECMKKVMEELFAGDINTLTNALGKLAADDLQARDLPLSELRYALVELTACLPVYRTYISSTEISDADRACLESTLQEARRRTPASAVGPAAFDFLRRVILLDPPYYAEHRKPEWLEFVMRWQQFTGPVMAKGIEDTAFYRHTGLLSFREVGGDPGWTQVSSALDEFHEMNRRRLAQWPHSLNATSTHDTKWGEDARARINVLSEIPEEWERRLDAWIHLNEEHKRVVDGLPVPGAAEELSIYQTLLACWPQDVSDCQEFPARVKQFVVKAAREAKLHSKWLAPNETYEDVLQSFVDAILTPDTAFLRDFLPFQELVATFGALNSLSQTLLKIAAPGVPDLYQGSELWNLSAVDPDNRRPVDYQTRKALLADVQRKFAESPAKLFQELGANSRDPRTKLFLMYRALHFRRDHQPLFSQGDYLPVAAQGEHAEQICSFARRLGQEWAIAVAPRWLARLGGAARAPQRLNWLSTCLEIPGNGHGPAVQSWTNVITDQAIVSFSIAELLKDFPVALLYGKSEALQ